MVRRLNSKFVWICKCLIINLWIQIQKEYWKTGFLKQFERGLHSSYFATLPVNAFNIWLLITIYHQFTNFQKQLKPSKNKEGVINIIKYFLNGTLYIENGNETKICQIHFLPILLHYFLVVLFINLFANLEILMRVVSTHPVYHWGYIYVMANKNSTFLQKIVMWLLLIHHSVFMVFEFTSFPLNVGTP